MSDKQKNIIRLNRKKLSSQQIKERENFDSIVSKHAKITKRPVYRQKRFYFILFVIVLIAYLIYYSEKQEKQKQKEVTSEQTN